MKRRLAASRLAALLADQLTDGPAYLAISDGLRRLISDGRIPVGTTLPSERELTAALGVSRTTVTRAYQTLKEAGYLEARHGSGSSARLPTAAATQDALLETGIAPDAAGSGGRINLSCAAPTTPPGLTTAYEAALAELPAHLHDIGYFPTGLPALREAIAERYRARGLPTDADQVIVTSGALSALAIVLQAFGGVGDRAVLESPTYPNAIAAFRGAGLRVAGADIQGLGWAGGTSSLTDTLRQVRPALAYLMPDWQNPTGLLMRDEHRAEVALALRAARTLAVVDETTAELAIDAVEAPLPFAAHLADTVTLGSASKAYWGGLRLGWVRAPRRRIPELLRARLVLDLGAPVVEQLALVHLLARHDTLMEVRREQLGQSRATLVAALARALPSWTFRVPGGGLSLWCELPRPASSLLVGAAERHGVRLAAGPLFAPEGGLERYVRVPFTQPPEVLDAAVVQLAHAWADTGRPRGDGRREGPLPVLIGKGERAPTLVT